MAPLLLEFSVRVCYSVTDEKPWRRSGRREETEDDKKRRRLDECLLEGDGGSRMSNDALRFFLSNFAHFHIGKPYCSYLSHTA